MWRYGVPYLYASATIIYNLHKKHEKPSVVKSTTISIYLLIAKIEIVSNSFLLLDMRGPQSTPFVDNPQSYCLSSII